MKQRTLFFLIAVMFLSLTGCGGKGGQMRVNSVPLTCPEDTPPGESCLLDIGGTSTFGDGTIFRGAFKVGGDCWYKIKDEKTNKIIDVKGPCGSEKLALAYVDDRGNVALKSMGGALVNATGDVLSAREYRKGTEYAAKNRGPSSIQIIDNQSSSGSSSYSGASAFTGTEIGIEQTETSCPSGSCYDPTQ